MVQQKSTRAVGLGRVLIAVYAILALAASGRSVYQIATQFEQAPLAYSLSALSALVYIVATVALIMPGRRWYGVAWATISFELLGVVFVGLLSIIDPTVFVPSSRYAHSDHSTVWSYFGIGYGFVPLVLPVLGMLWLRRTRPRPGEDVGGSEPLHEPSVGA
jgi:cytochrome bd-type quinol oxidase subunit 2